MKAFSCCFGFIVLLILFWWVTHNRIRSSPNMSKLQASVVCKTDFPDFYIQEYNDETFSDGANFISFSSKQKPELRILKADIVTDRIYDVLFFAFGAYVIAVLIMFRGTIKHRGSKLYPYLCLIYLFLSALFLYSMPYEKVNLSKKDEVSDYFVKKNVNALLDLQKGDPQTRMVKFFDTPVFVGNKTQFGIDFIRLMGNDGRFFYVGDELDVEKLRSYNEWVVWKRVDDNIFCCRYEKIYQYTLKVKFCIVLLRCCFYILILAILLQLLLYFKKLWEIKNGN